MNPIINIKMVKDVKSSSNILLLNAINMHVIELAGGKNPVKDSM